MTRFVASATTRDIDLPATYVRLWHKADIPKSERKVSLTQSGHAPGLYGLEDGCPLVMTCLRRSGLTEISPVNGLL